VTTVIMGNCGVGFAPCRPGDRDLLVNAMEGVEDIPGVVMAEGLTWEWESLPAIVNGRVIQRDGAPTGELPGRLVRLDGASAPRAEEARLERATSWKS
jgi:N-acyl-D-aspartate/D-glutamate deacylase